VRSETTNYVLTGTTMGNALGATATATGWIQTANEYIPLIMAGVAIAVVIIQGITVYIHWNNRKR